jgi:hypothetical protein
VSGKNLKKIAFKGNFPLADIAPYGYLTPYQRMRA